MSEKRPHVVVVCNKAVRDVYLDPVDLARLEGFASWEWVQAEGGPEFQANADGTARESVRSHLQGADAVVFSCCSASYCQRVS